MLATHRQSLGLSQAAYAARLGVSQPYLSQLESGQRPLTTALRHRLAASFPAHQLPLALAEDFFSDDDLAATLATLGYPGFAHLAGNAPALHPAVLLMESLRKPGLSSRLLEGLVWLLLAHPATACPWLVDQCRLHNLQNHVGFLATLANELAPRPHLSQLLTTLAPARLATEQTFGHQPLSNSLANYVRTHRTPAATHWNLLTDLQPQHLTHATA
jgi:transcriptional regulator with XRE-family HTH domain